MKISVRLYFTLAVIFTTLQVQAQTAKLARVTEPSAPQTQEVAEISELKAQLNTSNTAQNLAKIDAFLVRYAGFSREKKDAFGTSSVLTEIIKRREQECLKKPILCTSPQILKMFLCTEKTLLDGLEDALWVQTEEAVRATSQAAQLLQLSKTCAPKPTYKQFVGVMKAMSLAARVGDRKTLQNAVDFASSTWKSAPEEVIKYIELVSNAQNDLDKIKPQPVDLKLKLVLTTINWTLTTEEKDIFARPSDLIGGWLVAMPGLLTSTGQGYYFVSLYKKYPNLFKNSAPPAVQLALVDGLCLYLRDHGKINLCEKLVSMVKANPAQLKDPDAMTQIAIQEARNSHANGRFSEAISKLDAELKSTQQAGYKAWILGVLSASEVCNKSFAQAKSHLDRGKQLTYKTAGSSLPWLPLYSDVVDVGLLIDQKKYSEASNKITEVKSQLPKLIAGNIDILIWMEYYEVFIHLQKKDQAKAVSAYNSLKKDLVQMPAYNYIGYLGDALMGASKGTAFVELNKAKGLLGAQNCDYTRAQAIIQSLVEKGY